MTRLRTIADDGRRSNQGSVWSRPEMLASLAEINERYLDVLVAQSRSSVPSRVHTLVRELRPSLLAMNAAARRRAATCPYLLADVGFTDPQRWVLAKVCEVRDVTPSFAEPAFTLASHNTALMRLVLTYAWHLARTHASAARMILGMPSRTTDILRGYTLRQMTDLAELHPQWLQPRWPNHLRMWRELIDGAIEGEGGSLDQARMRGVQLLAAEARSSASA